MKKHSGSQVWAVAILISLTAGTVALAQATDDGTADILRRAMRYQLQFRADGQYPGVCGDA
jgi:hypothetical protein